MSLDSISQLGEIIGGSISEQDQIKDNIRADSAEAIDSIGFSETIVLSGTLTGVAKQYATDSFIIDHVVYGELDSTVLKLDGGHSLLGNVNGTVGYWPLDTNLTDDSRVVDDEKEGGTAYDGEFKITMAGYYPFNGNADDESTHSNDGVVDGPTLTIDYLGNANNAYDFDGASGDIVVTDSSEIQDIFDGGGTIDVRIKIRSDGQGSAGRFLDKVSWHASIIQQSGDKVNLQFSQAFSGTNGVWRTNDLPLTVGTEYDILITYDNGSVSNNPTLYIDGVAHSIAEQTTPVGTRSSDVGGDLYIGNGSTGVRTFDGVISSVSLIERLIVAGPALDLYNITKIHKLDKPLNNNGFDFWGTGNNPSYGTYVSIPNFDLTSATVGYSIFFKITTNWDENNGGVDCILGLNTSIGGNRLPIVRKLPNNNGTLRFETPGATSFDATNMNVYNGREISVLVQQTASSSEIFINGVSQGIASPSGLPVFASNDILNIAGELDNAAITDIITANIKTMLVINRILTTEEKADLQSGILPEQIKFIKTL